MNQMGLETTSTYIKEKIITKMQMAVPNLTFLLETLVKSGCPFAKKKSGCQTATANARSEKRNSDNL